MRHVLAGLLVLAACATRGQPYRFASPMLGAADVPPEPLSGVRRLASGVRPDNRTPDSRTPDRRTPDSRTPDSRTPDIVVAPIRVASAAAADAVVERPHAVVWSRLPAPHRLAADPPAPVVHAVTDLRALVGRRDKRDPLAVVLDWAHALGEPLEAATGPALVTAADAAGRLAPPSSTIAPGELLVFDHTEGGEADLVALAIGRDARGVVEFAYLAGGVVRRGFVDPQHPAQRRDANGASTNTFLRAGKRWPPKGTHYLAGELLAHVVHRH